MTDRSAIPSAPLAAVDPQAAFRLRRLEVAVELVQSGRGQREASAALRARFGISTATDWRAAGIVFDLAGSPPTGAAKGRADHLISNPLVNGRLTGQRRRS